MRLGDIVFASHIKASLGPRQWASYSAPTGYLFAFVLLGEMERVDGTSFDAEAALQRLGWVRAPAESSDARMQPPPMKDGGPMTPEVIKVGEPGERTP